MPRNFINWSCKLTLCQREWDGGGGQPPVKSEVRAQNNKVGRLWFFGGRCSRISRGTPEVRSCLCICQASFFMTFAMSGVPLVGSQQQCMGYKGTEGSEGESLHLARVRGSLAGFKGWLRGDDRKGHCNWELPWAEARMQRDEHYV